jgi:hypothetical protein
MSTTMQPPTSTPPPKVNRIGLSMAQYKAPTRLLCRMRTRRNHSGDHQSIL